EQFFKIRPHAPFAPPSILGTIIFPGFDGGGEWGGAAADPDGVLYVNANEMPWILTMVFTQPATNGVLASGPQLYAQICAACHGMDGRGNAGQHVPRLVGVTNKLPRPGTPRCLE